MRSCIQLLGNVIAFLYIIMPTVSYAHITWQPLNSPGTTKQYHMKSFPGTGGYFAAYDGYHLFLSNSFGKNYSEISLPSFINGINNVFLASNFEIVIIDKSNKIYYSKNFDNKWHEFGLRGDFTPQSHINFKGDGPYYIFVNDQEIDSFFDFDANWILPFKNKLPSDFRWSEAVCNKDKIFLFDANHGRILFSFDYGRNIKSWESTLFSTFRNIKSPFFDAQEGKMYFIMNNILWRIDNWDNKPQVNMLANLSTYLPHHGEWNHILVDDQHIYFSAENIDTDRYDRTEIFEFDLNNHQIKSIGKYEYIYDLELLPNHKIHVNAGEGQFIINLTGHSREQVKMPVNLGNQIQVVTANQGATIATHIGNTIGSYYSWYNQPTFINLTYDNGSSWHYIEAPCFACEDVLNIASLDNEILAYHYNVNEKTQTLDIFKDKTWQPYYTFQSTNEIYIEYRTINHQLLIQKGMHSGSLSIYRLKNLQSTPELIDSNSTEYASSFYLFEDNIYKLQRRDSTGKFQSYSLFKYDSKANKYTQIGEPFMLQHQLKEREPILLGYQDHTFFALGETGELWMSVDGGLHFTQILPESMHDVVLRDFVAIDMNTYLLATNEGIYVTNDGGQHFYLENTGLKSKDINSISYDRQSQQVIISAKQDGLYHYTFSSRGIL